MTSLTRYEKLWIFMSRYDLKSCHSIPKNLCCTICGKVMNNPSTIYCHMCGYCKKCIDHRINDTDEDNCPGDNSDCERFFIREYEPYKESDLEYKVARVVVECPHKFCSVKLPLYKMEEHVNQCDMDFILDNDGFPIGKDNSANWSEVNFFIKAVNHSRNDFKDVKQSIKLNSNKIKVQKKYVKFLDWKIKRNKVNINKLSETADLLGKERSINSYKLNIFEKPLKRFKNWGMEELKRKAKKRENEMKNAKEECQSKMSMRRTIMNVKMDLQNELDDVNKDIKGYIDELENKKNNLDDNDTRLRNKRDILRNEWMERLVQINWKFDSVIEGIVDTRNDLYRGLNFNSEEASKCNIISKWTLKRLRELILNSAHDFVWIIDVFSKRRGQYFSDSFYIDDYRLLMEVDIEVDGHFNVYLWILRSNQDDEEDVKWPMRHTISFSIINQETLRTYITKIYKYDTNSNRIAPNIFTTGEYMGGVGGPLINMKDLWNIEGLVVQDSVVLTCSLYSPL